MLQLPPFLVARRRVYQHGRRPRWRSMTDGDKSAERERQCFAGSSGNRSSARRGSPPRTPHKWIALSNTTLGVFMASCVSAAMCAVAAVASFLRGQPTFPQGAQLPVGDRRMPDDAIRCKRRTKLLLAARGGPIRIRLLSFLPRSALRIIITFLRWPAQAKRAARRRLRDGRAASHCTVSGCPRFDCRRDLRRNLRLQHVRLGTKRLSSQQGNLGETVAVQSVVRLAAVAFAAIERRRHGNDVGRLLFRIRFLDAQSRIRRRATCGGCRQDRLSATESSTTVGR